MSGHRLAMEFLGVVVAAYLVGILLGLVLGERSRRLRWTVAGSAAALLGAYWTWYAWSQV